MHCLNAFRIRIVIILLAIFIFWQLFRNWPSADDYSVRHLQFVCKTLRNLTWFWLMDISESCTTCWSTCYGNGLLWGVMSRFEALYSEAIATDIHQSINNHGFSTNSVRQSDRMLCLRQMSIVYYVVDDI